MIRIQAGNYSDIQDGDIVIITSGAAQKEGETRIDLLKTNASIIKNVIKNIKETRKDIFVVMVTNPVDILTYIAIKESGLPERQVFGSGTFLDTARLKVALSEKIEGINANSIHAYIMGEHGDTSFPILSSANVDGTQLSNFLTIDAGFYTKLKLEVKDKAYEIIKGKKATFYGIASAVATICKMILHNEKRSITLSMMLHGQYGYKDIVLGVPAMISENGAEIVEELELNDVEKEMMAISVNTINEAITSLNEPNN